MSLLLLLNGKKVELSTYEEEVFSDSPRGYWRLGEKEGTTAVDSSGKGHDGTYKNTPTLGVAGAIYEDSDSAVSLDSASKEFVEVADHADLDLGDSFSLEAWVKPGLAPAEHSIIAKGSGAYQMRIGEEGERELQLLKQDSAIVAGSGGVEVPDDGGWHHCVVTKNGSTVHVYIDGVDVTSVGSVATCENTATALRFGCKSEGSEQLDGGVDEIAVYAGELSAARILAHFEAGATPFEATPADSCWEFDGDATDAIGENDGEAVGAPNYGEELVTSEPSGKAIDLNGSSQYVKVPDDPSLRLDGSYWLTAWAELGSITGIREIIRKGNEYRLYGSDAGIGLSHQGKGAEFELAVDAEFVQGRSYRIDAVFDEAAETLKAYVNGRLIQTVTDVSEPPKPGNADLNIGARGGNEDRYWDGRLDKVRIRGEFLPTDAEVLTEYRAESDIVFADGFESGFSMWGTKQEPGGDLSIVSAEPDPLEGSYEMRAAVDPGGERAEVIPGHINFSDGDDIYVRDHFYLEPGFAPTGWGALFFQGRQEGEPEEKGADSPLVALLALPEDGEDPDSPVHLAVVRGPVLDIEVSAATYWLGPEIETGRWYDICIRIKFSEDPKKGLVEVWFDGVKQAMLTSTGRTARGDSYPKFGLYRDTDITTPGAVVHDGIAITRSLPFGPPSAITGTASGIAGFSATLNGVIDPKGYPTTYWFEYGETEAYGSTTPKVKSLEELAAVSAILSGLKPRTTYHFRLVAENAEGDDAGEDATFTTGIPSRIAVPREYPPDRLAVRIADPSTGQTIARWAEDENKTENVISGLTKSGEMPGGHQESGGVLPRDPRVNWPDTVPYLDYFLELPGGEKVFEGRLDKVPESDGDRMVLEPKAVGHQKALEDRKGIIGPGFIDGDLSKWGEPSAARRKVLSDGAIKLMASTSVASSSLDPKDPEAVLAAIVNDFNNVETVATDTEAGEADYPSAVDIGAVLYDALGDLAGGEANSNWESTVALGKTDTFAASIVGTDHDASAALQQRVDATGPGYRYARLRNRLNVASEGVGLKRIFGWRPKVLGTHGLIPQGTWPNIGFTAKQMLAWAIPLYTYLTVDEEEMEDLGYVIQQAWFSEPGGMDAVVKELTKYELLDWFVMRDKRFELRVPGSYGRLWQAYAGPSELKETGEDGSRLWDRIVGRYTDVDGSTRTVGWPGSGANTESEALIITDPDHPAVRAGVVREDLLDLRGISTPERAIEACERWLAEANELSHAGEATFRGYLPDDCSVFRPVSQVQPGDWARFTDAGSGGTGYRKIVAVSYDHDSRTAQVTLDAPPNAVEALLERYQAALLSLGL